MFKYFVDHLKKNENYFFKKFLNCQNSFQMIFSIQITERVQIYFILRISRGLVAL